MSSITPDRVRYKKGLIHSIEMLNSPNKLIGTLPKLESTKLQSSPTKSLAKERSRYESPLRSRNVKIAGEYYFNKQLYLEGNHIIHLYLCSRKISTLRTK